MKLRILYFLFLSLLLLLSCKNQGDAPQDTQTEQVQMEGQLSTFSCSDSQLTSLFAQTVQDFDSLKDFSQVAWTELLPYFKLADPFLKGQEADVILQLLWASYMQTGNKITVANSSLWEDIDGFSPQSSDSLVAQLRMYDNIQKLAYLAISVKKDSLARQLFEASNEVFQGEVKDKFDMATNSLGKGINADLLALSLDLIPSDQSKAVVRNVFSKLLENGLATEEFAPTLDKLLSTLTKYDQLDLAYRLIPHVPPEIAAKWMISDLVGIRPSLSNPGFTKPVLHPKVFKELDYYEGQLKTQYGLLYLRLDRSRPLRLQIKIPAKATLILPIKDPTKASVLANDTRLWMGGSPQPGPPGTKILDVAKDGIIVELSRGKYDFQIK